MNDVQVAPGNQPEIRQTPAAMPSIPGIRDGPPEGQQSDSLIDHIAGGAVLLTRAKIRLIGSQGDHIARALLDNSSQATLIKRSVAAILSLKPFNDMLTFITAKTSVRLNGPFFYVLLKSTSLRLLK